jgi:hypothetical protein
MIDGRTGGDKELEDDELRAADVEQALEAVDVVGVKRERLDSAQVYGPVRVHKNCGDERDVPADVQRCYAEWCD